MTPQGPIVPGEWRILVMDAPTHFRGALSMALGESKDGRFLVQGYVRLLHPITKDTRDIRLVGDGALVVVDEP